MSWLILALLTLAFSAAPAQSMTFEYRIWSGDTPDAERKMTLVVSGPIEPGDAARFRKFIANDPQAFLKFSGGVVLDSPGGSVQDALELAQLFRELLVTVAVFSPARCASSCFLLYVGAPTRWANGFPASPALAIHRPYFSQSTAEKMSPSQADQAHSQLFEKTRTWLQNQLVPQELIDKLISLPSSEAYWLTQNDINQLGSRAPWYEEWILARCPDLVRAYDYLNASWDTPRENEAKLRYDRSAFCESEQKIPFIKQSLRELGFALP